MNRMKQCIIGCLPATATIGLPRGAQNGATAALPNTGGYQQAVKSLLASQAEVVKHPMNPMNWSPARVCALLQDISFSTASGSSRPLRLKLRGRGEPEASTSSSITQRRAAYAPIRARLVDGS